ncbi:hypothetical protein Tco_1007874, partial [Tanacetum coccineum]
MESSNSNSKERAATDGQHLVKQSTPDCKQKLFTWDYDSQMTEKYFAEYTRIEVRQFHDSLIQHMESVKKSIDERVQLKRPYDRRVNKRLMQMQESEVVSSKALDANTNIRPINDQVPFAEIHLTAQHNVLTNEQLHTDQSDQSYDTYLLCWKRLIAIPLLIQQICVIGDERLTRMLNNIKFLLLDKHCISLEISIQQKEESFQSNKPCKNQDAPKFREFFKINDLKAQLQAKTTLICNLKNQIKSVKEASNEARLKKEINVLETINIELESSMAKLLAENEKLNKENEHLKQTYKELYDSIKKTRIQTKDHNDSLIAQVNSKTVENADLKAQIQEKVFANAALNNELRKLKGNSVDTKFAKASILGKPPLQPSRNHLVVRQPNAFTSERPRISRPRFASQVDEKNDLSKTVTPHYLPKVRESAAAKPHQVNAPNYSRNSHKESYGSNDMVHAYFLEDARKMTQDKTRIPSHKDMASTRAHCTPNACTPKPRNIYRSSPVSKCSGGMSNGEPLVDHSRNSSFFLDSKQFVCSICHKYIFNTNHDDCIIKILNKVNSRAKVQSPKIRNNNPVEPKNHTHKPGRQNGIGQRFSLNKSSAVHEKPHTPRSCLRWKPTGRIFKTVSLRWIPTGKMFTDSTTKVDSEPPNGSNDDITNPYECNQTLYFSAGTSNSSAVQASFFILMTLDHSSSSLGPHCLMMSVHISSGLVLHLDDALKITPAEQEAADIMKALKESKKMSKRQPRTGGSNEGTGVPDKSTVISRVSSEGTGNILGVPDESTVVSRVSSKGTGSKPGVPDEEKHMRLWLDQ